MKKFMASVLAIVMTVSLLAGCSGGNSGKTESGKAESSKTEASAAEASKAEESKAEESKAEAEESKAEESKAEESAAEPVAEDNGSRINSDRTLLTNWDGTTMALPIVSDGSVTLTAMQCIRDDHPITLDGLWYVTKAEEDTGVKVEYTQIQRSDWSTQITLMFASDEYCDMILSGVEKLDTEIYGVDQKILMPLDDLLQYMPVYKARLDGEKNTWKSIINSDGKMYGFAKIADDGCRLNGTWFINQTWLDNLKLEMPTTTNELLDVLRAFIAQDANGNGDPSDEIGYEAIFDEMTTNIFNAWGIPENAKHVRIDDDGHVQFMPFENGYREAVDYLATMYAEGLMDQKNITQDTNSKIATYNKTWDEAGEHTNIGMATCHRLKSMGWDLLENDLVWLKPITAEGYSFKNQTSIGAATTAGYFTSQNKNPEVSAKWIDYMMCDQCMYETFYGPEGTLWSWNDEMKCELGPEGDQGNKKYALGTNGLYYLPAWYYNETFVQPDYRVERIEYNAFYQENGYDEKYPFGIINNGIKLTPDQSAEIAQLFANIEALYDEAVADMIMHGVTDDAWNAMIDRLTGAGVERYCEIYQGAVDEYLAG